MPCYGPLTAYRPRRLNSNGQVNPDRRLVFKKTDSESGIPINIPCGKCVGCRLEQSRQWAVRCMHEKRLHNASTFVTLTYDDKHLPSNRSLVKSDLQNFMKRLRHETGPGLRFFGCGEYGDKSDRPHYHVLLLNASFEDQKVSATGAKYSLYTSNKLSKLWTFGNHVLGDVTFESCAYVARYCVKKNQNGKTVSDGRTPEFLVMSRRPGIGAGYFNKYTDELLSHDTIIVNGVPAALPRFYDNKLAGLTGLSDPVAGHLYSRMENIKNRRRRKISVAQRKNDGSLSRLRIREVVALAKLNLKRRDL